MRRLPAMLLGVLIGICPMLMAPTGGIPSRPTFQAVTARGANGVKSYVLCNTGSPANTRCWSTRADSAGGYTVAPLSDALVEGAPIFSTVRTSGTSTTTQVILGSVTDNPSYAFLGTGATTLGGTLVVTGATGTINGSQVLTLASGGNITAAPTISGNAIATETSGTFSASFDDACSTTPTASFDWVKVGNLVTMRADGTASGFPCTSDSTSFRTTGAPAPAAIRGAAGPVFAIINCVNNGAGTACGVQVDSSGNVSIVRLDAAFATATWTNSGSKSYAGNSTNANWSYMLLNP